jgi:hypothetical protein
MAGGPTDWCRTGFGRIAYSPMVAVIAGRSPRPQGAPSLFRSLGEAAAPCFRKRLDPRMGSKGAQKITDMVTDGFAA